MRNIYIDLYSVSEYARPLCLKIEALIYALKDCKRPLQYLTPDQSKAKGACGLSPDVAFSICPSFKVSG